VIKARRERKGWTQGQLAVRSGLGAEHISMIERGIRENPTVETVGKLADALDVSCEWLCHEAGLVHRENPTTALHPDVEQVDRIIKSLPPAERVIAEEIMIAVVKMLTNMAEHTDELRRERRPFGVVE